MCQVPRKINFRKFLLLPDARLVSYAKWTYGCGDAKRPSWMSNSFEHGLLRRDRLLYRRAIWPGMAACRSYSPWKFEVTHWGAVDTRLLTQRGALNQ